MTSLTADIRAQVAPPGAAADDLIALVVYCGGERYGLPIRSVFTVFLLTSITPVPLGPPDVVGLVNLRGAIVPAISLRRRLAIEAAAVQTDVPAVGLSQHGEQFALLVDRVGDVVELSAAQLASPLPNVSAFHRSLTDRIYRHDNSILPILDVPALLDAGGTRSEGGPSRGVSQ